MRLDASIPANNWKIIELYNKLKKGELDPNPDFQRKLVWKKQHKFKFVETILFNFPFPEIYIAPGEIDVETLILKDIIVDGQQRCTTIKNYIQGEDVFGLDRIPIKKYSELSKNEKEDFLSYEVSIRYLKNATNEQIREIFQRINNTEYSLNKTERLNAKWGESEFVCIAKQLIEEDLDINMDNVNYKIEEQNRATSINFFHTNNSIFSENDVSRMLALQYILTLIATLIEGEYFGRNTKSQKYIEKYFEEFIDASVIEEEFISTLNFISTLGIEKKSYWFNKANLFTLICELFKLETSRIDVDQLSSKLLELEINNLDYNEKLKKKQEIRLSSDQVKYFEFAREVVNDTAARKYRGEFISNYLNSIMTIE